MFREKRLIFVIFQRQTSVGMLKYCIKLVGYREGRRMMLQSYMSTKIEVWIVCIQK